ncbi:spermidine/putrescine import ATP-binding protein Pot [Acidimicrobiaceae bacterium]|nr:spermidine/putrescine import ATP-binding protein Pot [Acidimicrobiaceae bacterium]
MLECRNLVVTYESTMVLENLSIYIGTGEIVALTGPSGAGKTTLLRCIAGLAKIVSGTIHLNGEEITTKPAHLRCIGLVFQDNQLFPHLNVAENIAYSLRLQRIKQKLVDEKVAEVLELVGLGHLSRREVIKLSGGEAKRIAVARALVAQPKVLLLDEPLSGLDKELHTRLLEDLGNLLRLRGTTTIHVTHDQDEAAKMADRVLDIRNLMQH